MNEHNFSTFERNRYFYGKLLTVRDFETEQTYHNKKRSMLNRLVTGAGVVCGLGVSASDESTLMIESGMAIDYRGREIVVPEILFRKLRMLEGVDQVSDRKDAYLCLSYAEEGVEPVNATGAQMGAEQQFDLTREGTRLYLSGDAPAYQEILEAQGLENVTVLYQSDELTLVLAAPAAVVSGEEFEASILVVKNGETPPVQLSLEGENTFIVSDNSRLNMTFKESREEKRCVYTLSFPLRAKSLSGVEGQYFPSGCELNVEIGSHRYKNYLTVPATAYLCRDREEYRSYRRRFDSLERHTSGGDVPIYLAKLELIRSDGGVFIGGVTALPFGQSVERETETHGREGTGLEVTTSVRSLEYWQRPDVKAVYQPSTGGLHLDFGIPSPEQYDYAVAHGTVDIALPGGLRVNAKAYSEEIAHGLGSGAVDVRLSLEFVDKDREETALLCGNSEVFRGKGSKAAPPWVEAAAIVYPERGTMRVGLWLHDTVEGNLVRVHYFAQKPERDTSRILSQRSVSIAVTPEFSRLEVRGKLQFHADVVGSEDKSVRWSVREENGGVIDHNGLYQAPELPGTYEIVATAGADETVAASAFVIVE